MGLRIFPNLNSSPAPTHPDHNDNMIFLHTIEAINTRQPRAGRNVFNILTARWSKVCTSYLPCILNNAQLGPSHNGTAGQGKLNVSPTHSIEYSPDILIPSKSLAVGVKGYERIFLNPFCVPPIPSSAYQAQGLRLCNMIHLIPQPRVQLTQVCILPNS